MTFIFVDINIFNKIFVIKFNIVEVLRESMCIQDTKDLEMVIYTITAIYLVSLFAIKSILFFQF